jgi:hypothetical protein
MDREDWQRTLRYPARRTAGDSPRRGDFLPQAGVTKRRTTLSMVHFTCDLCGKELFPEDGRRYVVKMEIYAAHDPAELTEADLDQDHMDEVSQMLMEQETDEPDPDEIAPAYKKLRYDLCAECHKKFLRDPLNKESAQKFHFSEN